MEKKLELELRAFSGPFDLLLHLIKELKVDINDIPMKEITDQYLTYVRSMQDLKLDIVGDYLVMAATLIEIKSRLLLPIEPDAELDGDYEPEDPRQILVQQLLLYQQFQDAADHLEIQQSKRAKQYTRPQTDVSNYQTFVPLEEGSITLDNLASSLFDVIKREMLRQPQEKEIHHDPVSVSEKMEEILTCLTQLNEGQRLDLSLLMNDQPKSVLITTFMAMLELVRKHQICFYQSKAMAKIEISKLKE